MNSGAAKVEILNPAYLLAFFEGPSLLFLGSSVAARLTDE